MCVSTPAVAQRQTLREAQGKLCLTKLEEEAYACFMANGNQRVFAQLRGYEYQAVKHALWRAKNKIKKAAGL